jgi:hypothetical protein
MRKTMCTLPVLAALLTGALFTGTAHAATGLFLYGRLGSAWEGRLTDPVDGQCIALPVDSGKVWNKTNRKAVVYSAPNCNEQRHEVISGGQFFTVHNDLRAVRFVA